MTEDVFINLAIRLFKEGFIDWDDAWLLINAFDTPLWDDKANRLLICYLSDLRHGVPKDRAVKCIHYLLNHLYGHDFYQHPKKKGY